MNYLITLAVALSLSFPVFAQNVSFGPRGESLAVTHLTTLRAEEGETEEVFVSRVGAFLDRYTRENGYEACAPLSMNSDRLIARVSTSNSQIGCVLGIRAGDEYVGRSIHSHPEGEILRLTATDNVFLRGNGSNHKGRVTSLRRTYGPSDTDRKHEGYLVEGGMITFFSPGLPDQMVGPVAESPLPPSVLTAQASF